MSKEPPKSKPTGADGAASTAPALATSTPAATTAVSTTDRRPDAFAPKRAAPVTTNVSGRVRHDDRGNAVWEWALTSGAFAADSSAHRLKKLSHPLSLAEDAPSPSDTVKSNPLGTIKGYSPYDSGVLAKGEAKRKKDLRKLSEWLKLRKQASNNDPYEE